MENAVIITSEGRIKKNIQWLPKNLDYQGIARRLIPVEPMPPGAQPIYDRDIDVSAVLFDEKKKRRFKVIDRTIKRHCG